MNGPYMIEEYYAERCAQLERELAACRRALEGEHRGEKLLGTSIVSKENPQDQRAVAGLDATKAIWLGRV